MALVAALAVGVGGSVGALARYAVGNAIERRGLDTFTVNVLGSFVLGVVLAVGLGDTARLAFGVGFCGAFTTFSSFAVESVRLAEDESVGVAAVYATGTLVVALLAVVLGSEIGAAIA